jgi:probable F420-dependent oxidoreductase
MQVGIHLPQFGRASSPDAITDAARLAEELGFADVWVSDHVAIPAAQDYPSPYLYDPLLSLTWAAAATERVGLGTSVLVVPQHTPLALANSLASLDALSGGRLTIGAGVGWSEAEFAALGKSFADRGRRMDETLDVLRACWGPDPVDFHGEFVHLDAMKVQPKPAHPIPIWVGGRSEPAYRRAAARGDGFHAIGLDPDGARRVVERMRRDRPEPSFTMSLRTGWDPQGMEPDVIRREYDEFEVAGIQHVVSAPWRNDPASWMRSMELLAELVLAR